MSERDEWLDPLEAVLPPEGVVAARLRDVVARAEGAGAERIDVAGVKGSAGAALAAALARAGAGKILFVAADLDGARRAAQDCGFLLRGAPSGGGGGDDEADAEEAASGEVLLFTGHETSPYADLNTDRRAAMSRMATLFHLAHLPWKVLALPASALVRKVVPRAVLRAATERVQADTELDRDRLVQRLAEGGYLRVPLVEDPGSFAVRGSLLDVWPPSSEVPFRVELYGELVLSIKPFDPYDQRTRKLDGRELTVPEVWLPPAREAVLTREAVARAKERVVAMADAIDWPTSKTRVLTEDVTSARAFFGADGYLPAYYDALEPLTAHLATEDAPLVILEDPAGVTAAVREELAHVAEDEAGRAGGPHFPVDAFYRDEAEVVAELERRRVVTLHATPVLGDPGDGLARFEAVRDPMDLAARDHEDLSRAVKQARGTRGKSATLAPLARRIHHWNEHGLRVFLTARAETQAERLTSLLRHQGIACRAREGAFDPAWLTEPLAGDGEGREVHAQIVVGPLSRGAVLPAEGLVLVTEEEIFGQRAHRRKERKAQDKSRPFVEDLRSLSVGDFVVHVEHGIGRYHGLVHKDLGGIKVDLLVVEYAGGDKLYLPAYRLNQIQKYSGGEHGQPKLDRLGGSTFSRTKARVQKAVRQMADELLRLYAERQAQPGVALPPIDDDYRAFEATFPFDETPDQARAIAEVNGDLGAARPMDRLVCGDVGFGKTEVALRAAFRAAMAGKQVALLCPTTVLAQQHLRTFEARMRDYPVTLRAMSRFQTKKEQDETARMLKEGKCDVVVGTHRLLSKDIHFKDLGLLIVDEEQRFGVTHKERIKQIRTQVDVLTLTATPIPRTLQMAVSGMRDLSLITTPPVDRRAVRTLVTRFDEQVIREAVTRELSRGGQIFYVYNRVEGLHDKAQRLQELVPHARIAVAHGQMTRGGTAQEVGALEQTMFDFVEGRYDILVATAIVESGLDIPRANTILIDRADLFGLAQLYQLRGRVGRSKERAYCYLIVPPVDAMSDESRARIEALERHTELGSGFQIASLDLELRGAGDLLGGEQSGNVASVGFDLFCQMLDEAVHELRGEAVVHDVDPELSFDVEALLPEDYVADVGVRLSLYKRLAGAIDEAHVSEIAEEMEDRFGAPPPEARQLVRLMAIKTELRRLRVLGCEANARSVTLHLREDTPLDPKKVLELVRTPKSPYRLTPDMRLSRRFDPQDRGGRGETNGVLNVEAVLADLARYLRDDSGSSQ